MIINDPDESVYHSSRVVLMDLNEAWSLCGCEISIQTLPMVTNQIGRGVARVDFLAGHLPYWGLEITQTSPSART